MHTYNTVNLVQGKDRQCRMMPKVLNRPKQDELAWDRPTLDKTEYMLMLWKEMQHGKSRISREIDNLVLSKGARPTSNTTGPSTLAPP